MKRAAALAAIGLLAGFSAAGAADAPETLAWWRAYEAATPIRVPDGRRLSVYCMGSGSPVAVFETGLGGGATGYRWVQPQIARTTRACVYNRAGYGHSDEARDPRDLEALSADLGAVIKAVGQGRPVVLVGHSFGGPITRYFAYRHPKQVAGMVLIDPSGDDQGARFAAAIPGFAAIVAPEAEVHRKCLAAWDKGPILEGSADYKACVDVGPAAPWPPLDAPAELKAGVVAERGAEFRRMALAEWQAFAGSDRDARQAAAARRPLGDIPLIVLTRGQRVAVPGLTPAQETAATDVWGQMHWEIAQLSTHGRRRFVEGAGHNIHTDKPEAVIAAVEEVVAEARARRR
jgi:pimeloyl-ACP methyl ester carboxylesterase